MFLCNYASVRWKVDFSLFLTIIAVNRLFLLVRFSRALWDVLDVFPAALQKKPFSLWLLWVSFQRIFQVGLAANCPPVASQLPESMRVRKERDSTRCAQWQLLRPSATERCFYMQIKKNIWGTRCELAPITHPVPCYIKMIFRHLEVKIRGISHEECP